MVKVDGDAAIAGSDGDEDSGVSPRKKAKKAEISKEIKGLFTYNVCKIRVFFDPPPSLVTVTQTKLMSDITTGLHHRPFPGCENAAGKWRQKW